MKKILTTAALAVAMTISMAAPAHARVSPIQPNGDDWSKCHNLGSDANVPYDLFCVKYHLVEKGDTLWWIAGRYCNGNHRKWTNIAELNEVKPRKIYPGMVLHIVCGERSVNPYR